MAAKDKSSWVQKTMAESDAMDLEPHVFQHKNPEDVAKSLKASTEQSNRRKSSPFRSAMSMLNFHINRSGRRLAKSQKRCSSAPKVICVRSLAGHKSQASSQISCPSPARAAILLRGRGRQHLVVATTKITYLVRHLE